MELLKKMLNISSPSGSEGKFGDFIKSELQKNNVEITEDPLGNIIAHKQGAGEKIMLAAHMDEIGVIVTFIDDKGFLRFNTIGGIKASELCHRRVIFENGTVGVIADNRKADKKPSVNKMYIDIGAESSAHAGQLVKIGDTAAFSGDAVFTEKTIISKALDNKVGCYILIEVLKKISESDKDVFFAFTTQEEIGLRGAHTAAFSINPDIAISVDVTDTGDTPNADNMAVSLGGGAAVKVMDKSIICHPYVRTELIKAAKDNNIPYQLEVMTGGGTDAGAIHLSRGGIRTGGVSIPLRYMHTPSEMVSVSDIKSSIDLLAAYLNK